MVVSGDSLGMVVVTTTHSKPREGASVRLELELEEWGGKPVQVPGAATRPRRVWYWQCREGDWLPSRMNLDRCDKFFRVARVVNPDSVYVEFPGKYFVGGVSNGFITRSPRTWRTASFDGGYDLTLSVVR